MPELNVTPTFDGYIRVSRTNGRKGASYRSPGDQRDIIEGLAKQYGLRLDEVVIEEDVSGGKDTAMRDLGRLVEKIEAGESGGIIVWNVKRYSRDYVDGMQTFFKVFAAGGRLIAEDFSQVGQGARTMLSMRLEDAERELNEKRDVWARSTAGAAARGVLVGAARFGYTRHEDGTVSKITATCDVIARAYRLRAGGGSWSEVARVLSETGKAFTTTAARNLLASRMYKGYLPNGKAGEGHFHEHLVVVPPSVWEATNKRGAENKTGGRRDGGGAPLAKLLKCSGCGRSLTLQEERRDGVVKYRYYRCVSGKSYCSAPVRVRADDAEATVLDMLFDGHYETWKVGEEPDAEKVAALEVERDDAAAYVRELTDQVAGGARVPVAALEAAQMRLDAAQEALQAETGSSPETLTEEQMREAFEAASVEDRRSMIRRFLGTITVEQSGAFVPEKMALEAALAAEAVAR